MNQDAVNEDAVNQNLLNREAVKLTSGSFIEQGVGVVDLVNGSQSQILLPS